jgi:TPR repeat protein
MPKSMRPVVKLEDGEAKGQEAEGLQEEAGAVRAVQRRRVGEAGDADEARLLWLNMEAQAQAIQGVERARVLGEELLQAKARVAELAAEKAQLAAELKMRDEALRSIIQSKDDQLQSKDALLQAKDLLLQAKDSELRLLHADIARLNAGCAAAGAAHQPAPAPPAHVDAAAQGEALFQEGQRLYGEQRFSEAAERWGRAALLQHGPSHAHLSDMLVDGRAGVAKDEKRGFKLAAAGAALGCAHSKGALGLCYTWGLGVAQDGARGLALGRESEAANSCFGQFVVGWCYRFGYSGVAQDYAEAVRLYRLAAAQGHAGAQYSLGFMFENGNGVKKNRAEAIRWYRLAAAQGHAFAENNLAQLGA